MQLFDEPLGRMLSFLGKEYLHILRVKLRHLDIDRNYYALVLIDSHNGNITQQELALILDTDKVSIVRIIDYLSDKGYVKRAQNTEDRRKYSLVLTDKARLAIPEIKKSFNEVNDLALQGLNTTQVSELVEIIKKIKSNLKENTQAV